MERTSIDCRSTRNTHTRTHTHKSRGHARARISYFTHSYATSVQCSGADAAVPLLQDELGCLTFVTAPLKEAFGFPPLDVLPSVP